MPCRRVGRGAAFGALRGLLGSCLPSGLTRRTARSASSKGSGIDSLPWRCALSCTSSLLGIPLRVSASWLDGDPWYEQRTYALPSHRFNVRTLALVSDLFNRWPAVSQQPQGLPSCIAPCACHAESARATLDKCCTLSRAFPYLLVPMDHNPVVRPGEWQPLVIMRILSRCIRTPGVEHVVSHRRNRSTYVTRNTCVDVVDD